MSERMKYVTFRDMATVLMEQGLFPKGGQLCDANPRKEMIMVFPLGLTHAIVFELLKHIYPGLYAISAGFCEYNDDGFYCEGKSVSMKLDSRGQIDTTLLRESLWNPL